MRRQRTRNALRTGFVLVLGAAAVAAATVQVAAGDAAPQVQQAAPSNTAPPSIAGNVAKGQTLTASPGTWSGTTPMTFSYQWERCNGSGVHCIGINAVSSKTLTLSSADVGYTIGVNVTARNSDGSKVAWSGVTGVVTDRAEAPRNTARPAIGGVETRGYTLTADKGTWTGTPPVTYSYQWVRCAANGSGCVGINPISSATYVLASADVGKTIRVVVTAKNTYGSSNSASALTGVIGTRAGLVNSKLPTVSGTTQPGNVLTAAPGTWSGAIPITFAYSWSRCDDKGRSCASIGGAKSRTYKLVDADVGKTLRVAVTASNPALKSATVESGPTVVISAAATPQPTGAIKLANGQVSVPAETVTLPDRLVISGVAFTPTIVRTRTPFAATFRVTDTAGHVVRDALVYLIGLPYNRVAAIPERATGVDGTVTFQLQPTARFPLARGSALTVFVRARTPKGDLLAGASTRRLVQVRIGG